MVVICTLFTAVVSAEEMGSVQINPDQKTIFGPFMTTFVSLFSTEKTVQSSYGYSEASGDRLFNSRDAVGEWSNDDIFDVHLAKTAPYLTILSLRCTIAIDQKRQMTLTSSANELYNLATSSWAEVDALDVSSERKGRKSEYMRSLIDYITVSSSLRNGLPATEQNKGECIKGILDATGRLDNALKDINFYPESVEAVPSVEIQSIDDMLVTISENVRQLGESFVYMDAKQSNRISIYPTRYSARSNYYYEIMRGTEHKNAANGKTFLLLVIQVTHLGNLDGKNYMITTPALSAFTLNTGGVKLKPISSPETTSLGEMYIQKKLDRREIQRSILLFEVPESFNPGRTVLSVDLGSTWGVVEWVLEGGNSPD